MATCANDTLLNLHDLNKGQLVRSFIGGHQSFVTKCKISSKQNLLLSVGADGYLLIHDIRQNKIIQNFPQGEDFKLDSFQKFLSSLLLKDYLVYENEHDLYSKYAGLISQSNNLKQKQQAAACLRLLFS